MAKIAVVFTFLTLVAILCIGKSEWSPFILFFFLILLYMIDLQQKSASNRLDTMAVWASWGREIYWFSSSVDELSKPSVLYFSNRLLVYIHGIFFLLFVSEYCLNHDRVTVRIGEQRKTSNNLEFCILLSNNFAFFKAAVKLNVFGTSLCYYFSHF